MKLFNNYVTSRVILTRAKSLRDSSVASLSQNDAAGE